MPAPMVVALQGLVEYGAIAGSSAAGGTGAAVMRRLDGVLGFLSEHIVLVVGVVLGSIWLWRLMTRAGVR